MTAFDPAGPVVTFGEALAVLRTPTSLEHAATLDIGIGGAEGNVAIALARLGVPVAWAGRVSSDALGRRALATLRGQGVAVHATIDPSAPTAVLLKDAPLPGASRIVSHRAHGAGSRLQASDLGELPIEGARLLHLTGVTAGLSASALAALDHALERATAAGVPVSYDVNHRASLWVDADAASTHRRLAERAELLFAGDDEARLLVPDAGPDPRELLAELAELGPRIVVLKRGAAGALVHRDGTITAAEAIAVPVVDTVGAGDAFVAGYLAEHLAGRDAEACLATAVRCGAAACTAPGDWEGAPTRADLALLEAADPVQR